MITRKSLVFLITALLVVFLCGCNSAQTHIAQTHIAIVCGYHQNAPMPLIYESAVEDAIGTCVESNGSISIVVNDGAPYVFDTLTIDTAKVRKKANTISDVQAYLATAKARTPEVDTLEAIKVAKRSLTDVEEEKSIYVLDSGLSTTGELNFLDNLLYIEDTALIVDYLKKNAALPDLEGIEITWLGLGDVAGDQEKLSSAKKKTLEEIWTAILTEAGAQVNFLDVNPTSIAEDYDSLPVVTSIPTNDLTKIKISFIENTAEFKNYDEACDQLQPTVEYLATSSSHRVVLAGTTATYGSNESCKDLSLCRARAVKNLLIELGAQEQQIAATVGLGYEHRYHIKDLDADGNLTNVAQENRAVIIVDANSADALYMMSIQ